MKYYCVRLIQEALLDSRGPAWLKRSCLAEEACFSLKSVNVDITSVCCFIDFSHPSVPTLLRYIINFLIIGMLRLLVGQKQLATIDKKCLISVSRFHLSFHKQLRILNTLKQYGDQLKKSNIIEQMLPRLYTEEYLKIIVSKQRFSKNNNHLTALNAVLGNPVWDLLDRGGKRWRPTLCMLIAELYGKPRQSVFELSALIELIHNGSLILDDIEDDSLHRRGKECVHILHGVDVSINAGSFMYCAPMMVILQSSNYTSQMKNAFLNTYIRQITKLHLGQAWDIAWHNIDRLGDSYPNEDHYLEMSAQKTGSLARLAVQLVCTFVGAPPAQQEILCEMVQNLSVAFQIQDDILNLQSEQMKETKGYKGEDIHEGKLSLMVIHHLSQAPESCRARLIQILKMKTKDPLLIEQAIALIKSTDSIGYAQKRMNELVESAKKSLTDTFQTSETRELLKQLMDVGITRNK